MTFLIGIFAAAVMWVQVPQWADNWAVCAVDVPDSACHWYVLSPDFTGEGKVVHPLDFIDGDTDPNPDRILGDYHGTPCAGVAIAEQNGLGVIGSGPGCAFMPVRTSFQQRDSDWWNIFHEVSQHANIISCSWGPPPVYAPLSTALSEKFSQISANGGPRGKGCLIVLFLIPFSF